MPKNSGKIIIVSIWLFACVVFLSAFGGAICQYIIFIDSWHDLYLQKDYSIKVVEPSLTFDYIRHTKDDYLAIDLHTRMKTLKIINGNRIISMINTIPNITNDHFVLYGVQMHLHSVKKWANEKMGVKDLYLSKDGAGIEPYYFAFPVSRPQSGLKFETQLKQCEHIYVNTFQCLLTVHN